MLPQAWQGDPIFMNSLVSLFNLQVNPFEPSATGPPLGSPLALPENLKQQVETLLDSYERSSGVKAFRLRGEYGCGKTCLLRSLERELLPKRRIRPFYFDNPGVQFYDLANALLRQIGRKDFVKSVWELAGPQVSISYQASMFQSGFEEYLSSIRTRRQEIETLEALQEAIIASEITGDEEIAYCLARIVTESRKRPYFEYRDFIPSRTGSFVAEAEEAPYFGALLNVLTKGKGARGSAFLIDEFEEIGLQKRLSKRASYDYLATLKRLINLTSQADCNLWLFLSMTPDAYEVTESLDAALVERFPENSTIQVQPLSEIDALTLMKNRLGAARMDQDKPIVSELFPFPDSMEFDSSIYSSPRRLVKACFFAIANASDDTVLPFEREYLETIQEKVYSSSAVT